MEPKRAGRFRPHIVFPFALATAFVPVPAGASDPHRAYVFVEQVVLEPSDAEAVRIQVHGAIALSDGWGSGDGYPTRGTGSVYLECPADHDETCRTEWADIRASVGTGRCVGFLARDGSKPRIRSVGEPTANPDLYSFGYGVVAVAAGPGNVCPALKALVSGTGGDGGGGGLCALGDQPVPGAVGIMAVVLATAALVRRRRHGN